MGRGNLRKPASETGLEKTESCIAPSDTPHCAVAPSDIGEARRCIALSDLSRLPVPDAGEERLQELNSESASASWRSRFEPGPCCQ